MDSHPVSGGHLKLKPKKKGTIFVFNTTPQGMFGTVEKEIEKLVSELKNDKIFVETKSFVAFGPFDNVVRFEVDDFCLVNKISSLRGVSAQQIQCAYTIWDSTELSQNNEQWKPFCCLTQLKIQNHLMLGCGPEIEAATADLLIDRLKGYFEDSSECLEIELMATLGWDEFFIFMRNAEGYKSLFRPILKTIRGLTLEHLKPFLKKRNYSFNGHESVCLENKHLFLSSYSTPVYCLKLSKYLEKHFNKIRDKKKQKDYIINEKDLDIETLFKERENFSGSFGNDDISVSTRLSIKPGHEKNVRKIIGNVLAQNGPEHLKEYNALFSIGRYDIYPWLNEKMNCKKFVILFELLRFSLAGNLKRDAAYKEFLNKTQYYNSFTIISYIEDRENESQSSKDADLTGSPETNNTTEGFFLSQLEELCLGDGGKELRQGDEGKVPIRDAFERKPLKDNVPASIVIGLSRIFSLFDSCIMDRFVCDSFIDMYPFMRRVREIIDTIEEDKEERGKLEFTTANPEIEKILLPESTLGMVQSTLVTVFQDAIRHFQKGFVNRYLSSYPMMDKNETGVDFSGRLHRILSAITGMQNLLLDDLDCHLKKGFNVISTNPNIRIYRGSFNISESNVFHLFQPEIFYTMYHEIMHTYIYSNDLKSFRLKLNEMIYPVQERLSPFSGEEVSLLFQEVIGDVFLLKNGFYDDYHLAGFWYWLLLLQCKKDVDSNIILRFLLLAAEDPGNKAIIFDEKDIKYYYEMQNPEQLIQIIAALIARLQYPDNIRDNIMSKIKDFFESLPGDSYRCRLAKAFAILHPAVESVYPLMQDELGKFSYPSESGIDVEQLYDTMPLYPETAAIDGGEKRQFASIRMFRGILTFIYENRRKLRCSGDSVLNFLPEEHDLRQKLFHYRVALINTLQWESLQWKKKLIAREKIEFPIQLKKYESGSADE